MTHKDYEIIAAAVARAAIGQPDRRAVAQELANSLSETNQRFDRARFLRAAGAGDAA